MITEINKEVLFMNFSENLRRLRKAKDIKQEALAEAMNVSRQTVSKWENGTAMPDFKKLNALAEYFGVTMDELLGFSNDKNNNDNINDYTKEYINELITLENMQSSEKIKELYKKLKTCAVIFCVALAVIIFFMISINNQIDNLKSQINNVQSPQIIQDDSDDSPGNTHDMSDDASYEVLSFDKDKPWLANVCFTYAPETYSNSLKVTLEVPQDDNKTKELEFERKGGKFVLETQLDATIKGNYTLLAKDDSNTSTIDLTPDYASEYFNVDNYISTVTYKNTYLQFKAEDSNNVKFNLNSKQELEKAHLKIYSSKNKDKVLFEKDCRVADNTVFLGYLKAKIDYELILTNVDFEISATDKNGVKYIYYTNVSFDLSDEEIGSVETDNEQYEIEFPNGKTIINNSYDD